MNTRNQAVELSVIVVSFNGRDLLCQCLSALENQTDADAVEVVVVTAPEADRAGLDQKFSWARWAEAPFDANVPAMRRVGIDVSRGSTIAVLEDDCVPSDTWCACLIAAHRAGHQVVGGAVDPGDYNSRLDWAAYFSEYGRFMGPVSGDHVDALPGTNVSYDRDCLQPTLVAPGGFYEAFANEKLRAKGIALHADPKLVVRNYHRWGARSAIRSRFHHGRGYASMRVTGQPRWKTLPFLGLAALLPLVQVGRIVRTTAEKKRNRMQLALSLPWMALLSISWSAGEFLGYLRGPGNSLEQWR